MVALEFVGVHEAGPAGYDSVTWFYAPSGNFAACAEEGDSGALVGAVE